MAMLWDLCEHSEKGFGATSAFLLGSVPTFAQARLQCLLSGAMTGQARFAVIVESLL